jgi:hypothetical protein
MESSIQPQRVCVAAIAGEGDGIIDGAGVADGDGIIDGDGIVDGVGATDGDGIIDGGGIIDGIIDGAGAGCVRGSIDGGGTSLALETNGGSFFCGASGVTPPQPLHTTTKIEQNFRMRAGLSNQRTSARSLSERRISRS